MGANTQVRTQNGKTYSGLNEYTPLFFDIIELLAWWRGEV